MLQLAHRNFIPRNTRIIVPSNAGVNLISPHWRCRVVHKQISVIAHLGVAVMVAASGSREALAQITMTGSESAAISQIQMLPGHEAEVRKSVEAVRASTLQDPGCLIFSYDLDATLYEVFRSREALTQHSNAPATKEFLSELKGRVVGDAPVVTLLQQMPGPVTGALASTGGHQSNQDPTMPRGMDHVGVTVPDVDAAAQFFEQAFSARAVYDVQPMGARPMAGPDVERELGLPHGAKIVHMRLLRIGDGPSLELFQIADAAHQPPAALNDFGWTHIALYVDDIKAASRRFEAAGGTLLSRPHALAGVESGPTNRGVYGRPPWGGLIELITYGSGIQYPDSRITRWTPPPNRPN
jgi:catechol 2,3-dioxygenase-like lactoylglutathione lyase family enzyme/quinol monooxygenase YgiN